MTDEKAISESEAALYDRQIRLWGLDAQKRLRNTKLLIGGMGGLGAEITKNVVLAGVKSVFLLDDCDLTKEDTHSQFLAPVDSVGTNRAVASVGRVQELNPNVEITAEKGDIHSKDPEFFSHFDIICLTGCSLKSLLRVSKICREAKKKLLVADVFGYFGSLLSDLGPDHQYVEEVKQLDEGNTPVEVGDSTKPGGAVLVKTVKKDVCFAPLDKVLHPNLGGLDKKVLLRLGVFFLHRVIGEFRDTHGRDVDITNLDNDVDRLKKLWGEMANKFQLDPAIITEEMFGLCFGGLSPVCAIVGGITSQEIVKACSGREAPIMNILLYNGLTGNATVETVPS